MFDLFDFDTGNAGCCLIAVAVLFVVLALMACVFGLVLLGIASI